MSEAELLKMVLALAKLLGWRVNSRGDEIGAPKHA
jgi:hypothetical protein